MKPYAIGLYEKAIPGDFSFRDKLICAKVCGYDFLEISIDETDAKLSRLDWSAEERLQLVNTMKEVGLPIRSMCLSGHRKYPFGDNYMYCRKQTCRMQFTVAGMELPGFWTVYATDCIRCFLPASAVFPACFPDDRIRQISV